MIKKFFLIFIIFIFSISFGNAERNLLIGDIIEFNVKNNENPEILKTNIENQLKSHDFEIVDIKNISNCTNIKLKFWEIGEYNLDINNKKIKIIVSSALDKNEKNKEIFHNLENKSNKKIYWDKNILGLVGFILGIFGGILVSIGIIFKSKKAKIKTPEEKYEYDIANLPEKNWEYAVSMALRKYIDQKCDTKFVMGNYKKVYCIDENDIKFLTKLDDFKFKYKNHNYNIIKNTILRQSNKIYEKIKTHFEKVNGDIKNV